MKFLPALTLYCAALYCAPALCADREWTSYSNLMKITSLDKFYATSAAQRDKLRMLGTMKPNNPAIAPANVVFTVVHGDESKRIVVGADGTFDPVIDALWARDNPKVLTSMPAGEKAGFSFSVTPVLPAGLQFDYAALMDSVRQANALIKSQAGMMRFLMPTFVGVQMRFPAGQRASATIRSGEQERVVNADGNGVLQLPFDEATMAANPRVTLQQRPQSVDFIAD